MRSPFLIALALVSALASPARGQSFNVDFGPADSAPASSYAAAGIAGTWNAIGVLPPFERAPLVDLDGVSTGVEIYMYGGTLLMTVDDPATTGDDAALLEDMLIGYCDPVDVCIWVDHLVPGDYEVITYGLTPGDAARICPVRVDFGSPGPTNVGGAWPGQHVEGATYARHLITPTNQRIAFHSGTYNGYFQAGMNGFQIRKVGAVPVGPGDPAGGTGVRRVTPNPAGGAQRIEFMLAQPAAGGAVEVVDLAGRVVWREALAGRPAGPGEVRWSGRDAGGRPVAAGMYFARMVGTDATPAATARKLVRLD